MFPPQLDSGTSRSRGTPSVPPEPGLPLVPGFPFDPDPDRRRNRLDVPVPRDPPLPAGVPATPPFAVSEVKVSVEPAKPPWTVQTAPPIASPPAPESPPSPRCPRFHRFRRFRPRHRSPGSRRRCRRTTGTSRPAGSSHGPRACLGQAVGEGAGRHRSRSGKNGQRASFGDAAAASRTASAAGASVAAQAADTAGLSGRAGAGPAVSSGASTSTDTSGGASFHRALRRRRRRCRTRRCFP